MKKRIALLLTLAVFASVILAGKAQAQLITLEETFRVVEIDSDNVRIGIARLDANPTVKQNWVYVKIKTDITKRFEQNGWIRDEKVDPGEICDILEKGDVIRVNGGRGWDGSITAKKIIIYPENPETWEGDD